MFSCLKNFKNKRVSSVSMTFVSVFCICLFSVYWICLSFSSIYQCWYSNNIARLDVLCILLSRCSDCTRDISSVLDPRNNVCRIFGIPGFVIFGYGVWCFSRTSSILGGYLILFYWTVLQKGHKISSLFCFSQDSI